MSRSPSSAARAVSDHVDPLSALWAADESLVPRNFSIEPEHKTVIVLDHSPNFAASSKNCMEIMVKDSSTSQLRLGSVVEKSLWTCATECAIEFRRIVDEIYPDGSRLIRFVISDFVARFLTSAWGCKLVEQDKLFQLLSGCEVPDAKADTLSCSIINGISMAVEAISELSDLQKKYIQIFQRINPNVNHNNGGTPNKSTTSPSATPTTLTTIKRNSFNAIQKLKIEPTPENKKFRMNRLESMKKKFNYALRNWLVRDEESMKNCMRNAGSVVVFTTLQSDEDVTMIVKHLTEEITSRNKIINALDGDKKFVHLFAYSTDHVFAPISHVNLYVISLHPVGVLKGDAISIPQQKPLAKVNEYVSCSVLRSEANESLTPMVHGVILEHYKLASTTVTSIPMKEEAQQGQSANYDVEIFHPRRSHRLLQEMKLIGNESKLRTRSACGAYDTIKLSWTTPNAKTKWDQFSYSVSALPISPASLHSRPSVCLTSYLLTNRNVMLEVLTQDVHPPCAVSSNVGQKLVSHLLICHAGRIYLHTVHIGEHSILNDAKLSNKVKFKKASAMRVSDFATLMKESQLSYTSPSEENVANNSSSPSQSYNERARKHLRRITRYWPIKLCDSFIYNIPMRFEPLLSTIRKSELSTNDVNRCRECICALIASRDSKEPFTAKTIKCNKLKNPGNKDEQFRVACDELLNHLHNYVNHSERHLEVFNMFLQISGLDRAVNMSIADVNLTDQVSSSTPPVTQPSIRSVESPSSSPSDSYRSMSRSNSPLPKKPRKNIHMWSLNEVINVAELFNERYLKESWSRWQDFVGREQAGSKAAHLYPNLDLSKSHRKGDNE
ncbi:unnamed protein product [Anisakis simplex]|uniref:Protein asunder n=1 Tax=Anisakis simplex TaxID=6269 RepID=A0A158PN90_ANISI|nr:unnamed protein product [Anisakis simplex]